MKPTKQSLVVHTRARSINEDLIGSRLLVSFEQLNNAQISAKPQDSGAMRLRGATDHLRWRDLALVAEAVKTAFVRIDLAPSEALSLSPRMDVFDGQTITAYDLWFDSVQTSMPDLEEVRNVAQVVLNGITAGKEHLSDGLFEKIGDAAKVSALNFLIKETLTASGGRKFSCPIEVSSGEWKVRLDQKIARKPDRSDHRVVPVELKGKFVGAQTQKSELYFYDEQRLYVLNYAPDQILGKVLGAEFFSANKFTIRAHLTTDRKGAAIYAYLPDAPFKASTV